MTNYFITASGTDIGKTLVTTALCWQLRQQGKKVTALKPVVSGYKPEDEQSDPALILKSCGLTPTPSMIQTIAPWRYSAALAPAMAAAKEKDVIDFSALIKFCREHENLSSDAVLVEGAGGIMAPLTDNRTVLDWMEILHWPAILVGGNYLGAISHTLSAYEALKTRRIPVRAVIICESENSAVSLTDTVDCIRNFIPQDVPLAKIPRLAGRQELWKQAPLISWIVSDERISAVS